MASETVIAFSFTETPQARKIFSISNELQRMMTRAMQLVAEKELPELSTFELSIVAMADAELLELNRSALGHDYLTDILTFEIERTNSALEAEIYLSVERAKENATTYRQSVEKELLHLVIHGVLHLAGYGDKTPGERKQMRKTERLYLVQFPV